MGGEPNVVLRDRLGDHPAFLAWRSLTGADRLPTSIEILKPEKRKSAVYRMTGILGQRTSLIAKRRPKGELAQEVQLYTDVLPRLMLSTLQCYGSIDEDGFSWLFLEDAGDTWLSRASPEHRKLAVDWLARLHSGTVPDASSLPDTGTDYFRSVVAASRDGVRGSLSHPSLSPHDIQTFESILSYLDQVDDAWGLVVESCTSMPRTVVHGDFVPKNVRVRRRHHRTELVAFDWETAGLAPPVADLGMIAVEGDRRRYFAQVRDAWPQLRWEESERLYRVGKLFRFLHCVFWETRSFRYPAVERAKGKMALYEGYLRSHLQENPWLHGRAHG